MKILKLIHFKNRDKKDANLYLGTVLANGKILNFKHIIEAFPEFKGKLETMTNFISSGKETIVNLKKILASSMIATKIDKLEMDDVSIQIPLTPTRNIMCVGKNYIDHIGEIKNIGKASSDTDTAPPSKTADIPKFPVFFSKATTSVIGHKKMIESHTKLTQFLDYEAELAVIIGKKGKNIRAADAMDHIFGYTIANDITARDLQKKHNQWFKGKSLDTSCPLGPFIVPACDMDPSDLSIKLWLNGVLKQDSRTSNMIFNIPTIIESLSQGMTLLPGDVILTGTPSGVGYAMVPPRTLLPGDDIKIEIEGIGILENKVAD